jgi:hypothetical protein
MMKAIRPSEKSVLTRATQRNIPQDGILHTYSSENLKPYIILTGWAMYRRRNMSPVRYEIGFISHKTAFSIVPAVKTSNPT